jgi:EAL domain-containing protein (putative c-di-GMP-specific phosphodiesterase class I)
MDVLHRMGCEYLQGWLFGRPVDMAELTEVLAGFDPQVFDSVRGSEMDLTVH